MTRMERLGRPRARSVFTAAALEPVSPDSRMRTDGRATDSATARIAQMESLSPSSSVVRSSDCLALPMISSSLGLELTGLNRRLAWESGGVSEAEGGGLVVAGV